MKGGLVGETCLRSGFSPPAWPTRSIFGSVEHLFQLHWDDEIGYRQRHAGIEKEIPDNPQQLGWNRIKKTAKDSFFWMSRKWDICR